MDVRSRKAVGAVFGALLLAAGVLLLLEAMGAAVATGLFWGVLFLVAAVVFGYLFATDRQSWWAAIPGGALLGLGLLMLADEAGVPGSDRWGGALFLGAIGFGFAAVYLREHERWWAVIPAGVLLTLALPPGWAESGAGERASGAVFFAGLAVTFALVAVVPGGAGRRRWAWIPAAVLAVLAVLVALEATALLTAFNYLWPLALIVAGGFLLWRAVGRRRGPAPDRGVDEQASSSDASAPR